MVRVLAALVLLLGVVVGTLGVLATVSLGRFVDAIGGEQAASSLEASLRSASTAIGGTRLALEDLESLAGSVSSSSEDAAAVAAGAGELTAERIPDTLRDIESTMPSLIEAGAAIDGTLRALSVFGVRYDPATPFDEALVELDDGLEGLPEQIEVQGELLLGMADHLDEVGSETAAVAERMGTVNDALDETEQATIRLSATAGQLRGVGEAIGPGAVVFQVLFGLLAVLSVLTAAVLWGMARRLDSG